MLAFAFARMDQGGVGVNHRQHVIADEGIVDHDIGPFEQFLGFQGE
jgi:hypothetical protein